MLVLTTYHDCMPVIHMEMVLANMRLHPYEVHTKEQVPIQEIRPDPLLMILQPTRQVMHQFEVQKTRKKLP